MPAPWRQPSLVLIVILPNGKEHAEFVDQLRQAFRDAQPGDLEFIDSDGRANEVTIISIKNLFPLRFIKILPFLQERYQRRLSSNPERAALELHSEGDGNTFPPLFVKTGEEVKKESAPYLLLADALGMIHASSNAGPGALFLITKDVDGFENEPIPLGPDFLTAPTALDVIQLGVLKESVTRRLAERGQPPTSREQIQSMILARLEEMRGLVGGNVTDQRYRALVDGGRTAVNIVKGVA